MCHLILINGLSKNQTHYRGPCAGIANRSRDRIHGRGHGRGRRADHHGRIL